MDFFHAHVCIPFFISYFRLGRKAFRNWRKTDINRNRQYSVACLSLCLSVCLSECLTVCAYFTQSPVEPGRESPNTQFQRCMYILGSGYTYLSLPVVSALFACSGLPLCSQSMASIAEPVVVQLKFAVPPELTI